MATKGAAKNASVSFQDRLSRLTHHQACQLLGEGGEKLLKVGSRKWEIDPEQDVYVGGDLFRVRVFDGDVPGGKAVVVLTAMSGRKSQLHLVCDQCQTPCEHAGAALGLLLHEKSQLGLAAPPDETVPFELLTADELLERALDERRQRAATEKMSLRSLNPDTPWCDYILTSQRSGKTYRVALYGDDPGQSYCSCPDFRTNRLGTCKHILHTLEKVRRRFKPAALKAPYRQRQIALYVAYGEPLGLRFNLPDDADAGVRRIVGKAVDQTLTDAAEAMRRIRKLQQAGQEVLVYPDAETWIERQLTQAKLFAFAAEIRKSPETHPLRRELLKVPLLPY